MTNKKKVLSLVMVLALVLATIGGTMAWLMDKSGPVVNTFTVGNVDVTLAESENLDLKMVPGKVITKDPKVTLVEGSEDAWVFVKAVASANYTTYFDEFVADDTNWTLVPGETDVYYLKNNVAKGTAVSVIKGDQLTVKTTVTNDDMVAAADKNAPTLTFEAYAVQKDGFDTPAAAWVEAQKATAYGK